MSTSQGSASVIATVVIGILIVGGLVFYSYYASSSSFSSLSEQNPSLNQQVLGLNQQLAASNQQLSSLSQQVSIISQKTLTIVTMTNTLVSIQTTTSPTTVASVRTSTVFPVPDNVTVLFMQVSGGYSYTITAGSSTYTGSNTVQQSVPITPVFQGETITITASETGVAGCAIGQTVTVELFLNGQIVAKGTQICTGSNIQISYTI